MREIKTHRDGAVNERVWVETGEAAAGGAPNSYKISWNGMAEGNQGDYDHTVGAITIEFVKAGMLGVTNEALLAVVADRLAGFQSGPYACDENASALEHINTALCILKGRTDRRIKQGIDGKMTETPQPRIRITGDDVLVVGDKKLLVEPLASTWAAWTDKLLPAAKAIAPLTPVEFEVLKGIPRDAAARRGFTEFTQAMAQLG